MLPSRSKRHAGALDGRYADEALELFLMEIYRHRTLPAQYVTKVFGGGNMFPNHLRSGLDVGTRNIDEGLRLLADLGFDVKRTHVAGVGHRNVVFELCSGHVWLRHHEPPTGR
jgi:chemotaxis protein CheD